MRPGLKLIKQPGYYGPTRIGWVRRIQGDEYEMLPGWRTVWRTSGNRLLEHLAADGPGKDHALGEPSKVPNELNRHLIWASMPADEEAWRKFVPMPSNWHDG